MTNQRLSRCCETSARYNYVSSKCSSCLQFKSVCSTNKKGNPIRGESQPKNEVCRAAIFGHLLRKNGRFLLKQRQPTPQQMVEDSEQVNAPALQSANGNNIQPYISRAFFQQRLGTPNAESMQWPVVVGEYWRVYCCWLLGDLLSLEGEGYCCWCDLLLQGDLLLLWGSIVAGEDLLLRGGVYLAGCWRVY